MTPYFFSYRRMFGAIEIADREHSGLVEKAGREGFIENKAYRQLQAILKNFFVQLAADFFNEKSGTPQSEFYNQRKEEFNAFHRAQERRDKLSRSKKEKFAKELNTFFERLAEQRFKKEVDTIINDFSNQLKSVLYINDGDKASQKILDLEFSVRQAVADYKKKISVSSPKGFALSKALRMDFDTYLSEFSLLEETVFKPATERIDSLIDEYTKRLDIEISKRKRLEQAVEQISTEAMQLNKKKKSETNDVVADVSRKIKELTNDLLQDLDNQIRSVKDQFKLLVTENVENFDLVTERKRMGRIGQIAW